VALINPLRTHHSRGRTWNGQDRCRRRAGAGALRAAEAAAALQLPEEATRSCASSCGCVTSSSRTSSPVNQLHRLVDLGFPELPRRSRAWMPGHDVASPVPTRTRSRRRSSRQITELEYGNGVESQRDLARELIALAKTSSVPHGEIYKREVAFAWRPRDLSRASARHQPRHRRRDEASRGRQAAGDHPGIGPQRRRASWPRRAIWSASTARSTRLLRGLRAALSTPASERRRVRDISHRYARLRRGSTCPRSGGAPQSLAARFYDRSSGLESQEGRPHRCSQELLSASTAWPRSKKPFVSQLRTRTYPRPAWLHNFLERRYGIYLDRRRLDPRLVSGPGARS